mmetsp:Transcript_28253/g.72335  ORF Transcript_28253/g.72335 Transcript_28253/m.72335 type:complete len:308 (-) Transcript_28253:53-976(-)
MPYLLASPAGYGGAFKCKLASFSSQSCLGNRRRTASPRTRSRSVVGGTANARSSAQVERADGTRSFSSSCCCCRRRCWAKGGGGGMLLLSVLRLTLGLSLPLAAALPLLRRVLPPAAVGTCVSGAFRFDAPRDAAACAETSIADSSMPAAFLRAPDRDGFGALSAGTAAAVADTRRPVAVPTGAAGAEDAAVRSAAASSRAFLLKLRGIGSCAALGISASPLGMRNVGGGGSTACPRRRTCIVSLNVGPRNRRRTADNLDTSAPGSAASSCHSHSSPSSIHSCSSLCMPSNQILRPCSGEYEVTVPR